ncbi:MAG: shikimate kinase [Acholeplasmataceae bacterium]|jgi:shikimate kinase|nr:shikimate kinase [Acholeplasmataceae bacterium]
MRIYIIGMPGSGKSTVGRKLAQVLDRPFIDLDGLIEKDALMFIEDIFEKYGEKKFRELETEALKKIVDDNQVIVCGGGIVTKKENKQLMNGFKIYLDTDIELIRERLETDYIRPLLKEKSLDQIYQERYLKYIDFADAIISNDRKIDQTVDQIIEHLKKEQIL